MEIFFNLCLVLVGGEDKLALYLLCFSRRSCYPFKGVKSEAIPLLQTSGSCGEESRTFRLSPREIRNYRLFLSGLDMGHSVVRGGKEQGREGLWAITKTDRQADREKAEVLLSYFHLSSACSSHFTNLASEPISRYCLYVQIPYCPCHSTISLRRLFLKGWSPGRRAPSPPHSVEMHFYKPPLLLIYHHQLGYSKFCGSNRIIRKAQGLSSIENLFLVHITNAV